MAGLLDALQGALTGGTKAVTGIASGLSTMLSPDKTQDNQKQEQNLIYASFGMAGQAAKQRVTGGGQLPASATRSAYKHKSDNTEKLLTDVVKYLVSINNTLKKQFDFDRKVYAENALNAREAKIEQSDMFANLGKRYGADGVANDNQKKSKSGILSKIVASSLAGFAFNTLLKSFRLALTAFSTGWKWLRGLSFLKNIKSLASLSRALLTIPAAGALAATGTIVYGLDTIMKDARAEPTKRRENLDKLYGMKPVINSKGGFTTGYILPDGKTYTADKLPLKYRDILNAYGPGDNRGGTSDQARKRIAANPGAYAPDAMARELKGGEQVAAPAMSATQPGSTTSQSAYDVVYGNGIYGQPNKKPTDMTLGEITDFQKNVLIPATRGKVKAGPDKGTGAIGAYQFNYGSLKQMAAEEYGENWRNQKFDQATQDKLAKRLWNASKGGDMSQTWAMTQGSKPGQFAKTEFESVKQNIIQKEVGSYAGMPAMTPSSSSSGGIMQEASTVVDGALTSIADFVETVGTKIVGPGVAKNLNISPDFAKLISAESNKIQNELALGEKKKQTAAGSIPGISRLLRAASPSGSISVTDPNYSGGGIDKYLAHYKLA